ncbi:MAG: squalene/phytoene synthase family protein [Alphaproteobacteria bacterium]
MKKNYARFSLRGKRQQENFPVASLLLSSKIRPLVLDYYNFARAADDIADSESLPANEKISLLEGFGKALKKGDNQGALVAVNLHKTLEDAGQKASLQHAEALLIAFTKDAEGLQCQSFGDLMAYCAYSANPVGRFMLAIHDESETLWKYNDALCSALQIINHLQDCKEDYKKLKRLYIPMDWLAAEGLTAENLRGVHTDERLRRVFDRVLDEVEKLLIFSSDFSARVESKRLRLEIGMIWDMAAELTQRLRTQDPLLGKIQFSKAEKMLLMGKSLLKRGLTLRQKTTEVIHVTAVTRFSSTSFYWSMRFLGRKKREALYAVYAFCREVDDIADSEFSKARKNAELTLWRKELRNPETNILTLKALHPVMVDYKIEADLFEEIIDGVSMDDKPSMILPDLETLTLYSRRVAGLVGLVSLKVLGFDKPDAEELAITLGEALQFTNILRDIVEDLEIGRIYLPKEYFIDSHFTDQALEKKDLDALVKNPLFEDVCKKLAGLAEIRYAQSAEIFATHKDNNIRSPFMMMVVYRRIFEKLKTRGWNDLNKSVSLGAFTKLYLSLKAYILYK